MADFCLCAASIPDPAAGAEFPLGKKTAEPVCHLAAYLEHFGSSLSFSVGEELVDPFFAGYSRANHHLSLFSHSSQTAEIRAKWPLSEL